ncbi:MAG: hypothetical protein JO040_00200 [Gemmatimonadetes bacterium]|nr:hypothetical protein [Gemmatimonadota bacterium]
MALRTFVDADGVEWTAWETIPQTRLSQDGRAALAVSEGFEQGWLSFECVECKRRLAPIPEGWATCPEPELLQFLLVAVPVTRRTL